MNNKKIISAITIAALIMQMSMPMVFADTSSSESSSTISTAIEVLADSQADEEDSDSVSPSGDSDTDSGSSEDGDLPSESSGTSQSTSEASASGNADSDSAAADASYTLEDYTDNEVIVMYTNGNFELKQYASQTELAAALKEFDNDSTVELYQPNLSYETDTVTTETPNDMYYASQWALENTGKFKGYSTQLTSVSGTDINASEAWENYTAKRDVIIAMVDTGIDYSNSELADSMWVNEDEIAGNGIDDDGNGYIDDVYGWNFYNNNNKVYVGTEDNHGTHGAGTMVAASNNSTGIAGIADYDNIKLMSVKSLGGKDGAGTTLSLMMGIKYAEANGAQICNLSLGTDTNDPLLYRVMKNSNMLFVVAAGNSSSSKTSGANTDVTPSYPASYDLDNIISVANISADGKLHSTSDYGVTTVDLAAPGTDIFSTIANNKYGYMTGTSMAAPMVSAAAALVYSGSDSLTLADTKDILLSTTTALSSLSGKVATGGMLNAGAAVTYSSSADSSRDWDNSGSSDSGTSDTTTTQPSQPSYGTQPQRPSQPSNGGYTQQPSSGSQFTYINFPTRGGSWQFTFDFSMPSFFDRFFSYFSVKQ